MTWSDTPKKLIQQDASIVRHVVAVLRGELVAKICEIRHMGSRTYKILCGNLTSRKSNNIQDADRRVVGLEWEEVDRIEELNDTLQTLSELSGLCFEDFHEEFVKDFPERRDKDLFILRPIELQWAVWRFKKYIQEQLETLKGITAGVNDPPTCTMCGGLLRWDKSITSIPPAVCLYCETYLDDDAMPEPNLAPRRERVDAEPACVCLNLHAGHEADCPWKIWKESEKGS